MAMVSKAERIIKNFEDPARRLPVLAEYFRECELNVRGAEQSGRTALGEYAENKAERHAAAVELVKLSESCVVPDDVAALLPRAKEVSAGTAPVKPVTREEARQEADVFNRPVERPDLSAASNSPRRPKNDPPRPTPNPRPVKVGNFLDLTDAEGRQYAEGRNVAAAMNATLPTNIDDAAPVPITPDPDPLTPDTAPLGIFPMNDQERAEYESGVRAAAEFNERNNPRAVAR